MTLPKSWAESKQRFVAVQTIEWDAEKTTENIALPILRGSVLVAVENQQAKALTLTFEHKIQSSDANASVQIGEGENGVLTVTLVESGAGGNDYTILAVVGADPDTEMNVGVGEDFVMILLGTDSNGDPDDTKNTIEAIAAYINENHDITITAEASGDGSGTISAAFEPVPFTGGVSEVWAPLYDSEGTELSLSIDGAKNRAFGPFEHFPRFYGGRIVVTAAEAPGDGDTTAVTVLEV